MHAKRIAMLTVFLLFLTTLLSAQQSWEGSAIVGRYGEFPPGGLYAASNAFPLNSVIEVTSPTTGETQRLIVAQRAENEGVLLVVSQEAARALGVSRGSTFRVQIEPVEMPPLTSVPPSEDLPFHPDPDINPRAALGDPNEELLQPGGEQEPPETGQTAMVDEAEETPPPVAPSEEPAEEPAQREEAEAPTQEPTVAPSVAEAPAEAAPPQETPGGEAAEEPEAPAASAEPEAEGPELPAITLTPRIAPRQTPEEEAPPEEPEEAPAEEPEDAPADEPAEEPTEAPPEEPVDEPTEEPAGALAEGPGEKELFPPAPEEDLFVALAVPARPVEEPLDPELPVAPVGEELEVEAGSVGPRFANPVELSVTLPEPEGVESPEVSALSPQRPEERLPQVRMSAAVPGEERGPDMREEIAERPTAPTGSSTDIPLRIAEPPVPDGAEQAPITRPTGAPTEEVVALEPAEFRPPEPPQPEAEEEIRPDRPETTDVAEPPRVTRAPELPPQESEEERLTAEPEAGQTETPESVEAPAEPAPETEPPEPEQERPEEPRITAADEGALPMSSELSRGYYLQVGAFSTAAGARNAVNQLEADFPVTVVPSDGQLYRVFVGPLAEDERGAVLYLVRARGYRDAFLRSEDG